ncbi:MAG: 16S rRNA (adenine(1518)-N(6)/adenine(1519)-N(6))-dimethyltransferase RsmA [Chitinophagales bacterium]|nr:16S rRNA (adenine(1518)-N(6)/adenine(1519)-N(6))-dimethyltransferase RsmA [Chitinophagales bacterium]
MYLKKSLGQHFLKDENILQKIAEAIGDMRAFATVVEIGPGMGALTKHLLAQKPENFYVVELDDRWAAHLAQTFPQLRGKIIHRDFLQTDLGFLQHPTHVVGNFPYNISSQIVFRIIDYKETVTQMTGMFQKEVAQRIAANPGTKDYGVLSVLTQAYYSCRYLFDVPPGCFNPSPKVMSGVIQLQRKAEKLNCNETAFKRIVKAAFNQRRKTMRNSLRELVTDKALLTNEVFNLRPEQLSVKQFEELTNLINP